MITIGNKRVGDGQSVLVCAEIGINHNGSLDIAKQLIDVAKDAGCDAVKFQKRTPELCVPEDQRDKMKYGTPFGDVTYLNYKKRIEFGKAEFDAIDAHCKARDIIWFASCWDEPSVEFIANYGPPCYKIASACLTDYSLICKTCEQGRPILLSTGMSTLRQVDDAVVWLEQAPAEFILMQSVSTYPADYSDLNLRAIAMLRERYGVPLGYSGHEDGIASTIAAVALGACVVERHITLKRSMWGTDQAASLGPTGLRQLVRDIRIVEKALGKAEKDLLPSEVPVMAKLRRK